MHLSRRLMFSLFAGVAAVSVVFAIFQARAEMRAMNDEVEWQAKVLGESQQRPIQELVRSGAWIELQAFVDRFQNQQRVEGLAVYDATGHPLAITTGLAARLTSTPPTVAGTVRTGIGRAEFFKAGRTSMHILTLPLATGGPGTGTLAVFHDVSFLGAPGLRHALLGLAQTLLLVGITLAIVRWSLGKPLRMMAQWLRELRTGHHSAPIKPLGEDFFSPLTTEVTQLASSLNAARAAAEEEARLRDAALSQWTPERLRISMQAKLNGSRLFAVSNREPYEHQRQGSEIKCSVPPSGLVTALEPVLRASNGIWVAQGTGSADRETATDREGLRVPPDHPQYRLRRVFLSREEDDGFYLGFANEGLWPLCHIAHTRPQFRTQDWDYYCSVNRKFARVVLEEMEGEKEPVVLVQDYHFALLPRMIKEQRPDARVAIFWHIPWPNPEAFGICPWQRELLDGMLGADLIGFHIQAHCNNFLETVDHALESRIDWEHFAVNRRDRLTTVRPYPISVAFNGDNGEVSRTAMLKELGHKPEFLGVGVDRVDYTKGIPERLRGIERLLDQHPYYRERLTFAQIGAPSRTHIKRYQDLMVEVEEEAERINRRFRTGSWRPIVFLNRHHTHEEIKAYYRESDFCLVTSLHDGMNLVAKEYISSRKDERGSLILSRFTGASHELPDALIVNPYDTDELSQAIHTAITMPVDEQRARMQRMRAVVKEHNVYRWAGNLIGELAGIRLEPEAALAALQVR